MTRFGEDVESRLLHRRYKVSKESVFSLGFKLVNIIEQVHNSGHIFNDLKLDNVLLGHGDKLPSDSSHGNCFKDVSLSLIDFGLASSYIDKKTGEHIPESDVESFKGNLLFASAHQVNFKRSSRRDDMVAIFLIMVYLLNRGDIPGIPWREAAGLDANARHKLLAKHKSEKGLSFWCTEKASGLKGICQEIESLDYLSSPITVK